MWLSIRQERTSRNEKDYPYQHEHADVYAAVGYLDEPPMEHRIAAFDEEEIQQRRKYKKRQKRLYAFPEHLHRYTREYNSSDGIDCSDRKTYNAASGKEHEYIYKCDDYLEPRVKAVDKTAAREILSDSDILQQFFTLPFPVNALK